MLSASQVRPLLPSTSAGNLIAGATARTSVGFILMPMTVVKTRMESNLYKSGDTIASAVSTIWKTLGVRGLFTGFWPTTLRDAPTAGLFLVVYERTRLALHYWPHLANTTVDASAGVYYRNW